MGLSTLPYDLLLNIALFLDLRDIHALHLTCKALNDFTITRPVYRKLSTDLLRKCRALPLKGFQRLTDLTTEQLIRSVNQAARYDNAWRKRAPRPIGHLTSTYGTAHYMDGPHSSVPTKRTWYKVVSAPPGEEVDWLSPITSSYTLCATKSGKVVCWDVQTDSCLAEWNPGERWELWKCRVEFDERMVYFTMAKILDASQDDSRVMEFVLMRLTFFDPPSGEKSSEVPKFSCVTEFRTMGVVMNIFLLDPSDCLLSAFVWCSSTNTIGLYALMDWTKPEYVFIDTGIEYEVSANWSCILYDCHIVIHCEKPEAAHQYFYPFSLLRSHSTCLPTRNSYPLLTGLVRPARTLTKKFVFPRIAPQEISTGHMLSREEMMWLDTIAPHMLLMLPSMPQSNGAAQLAPIPPTVANTPPGVAFVASSSWNEQNGPVMASLTPALASSPPLDQENSPSAWGLATPSVPTPGAPLIPHASLPPQAHTPTVSNADPHVHSPDQTQQPNPFPFPTWYPESAHFVRQWWPTLPGIPRVSCTVVLLVMHDQETHRNRFVLAQHYFKVPIDWEMWIRGEGNSMTSGISGNDTTADTKSGTREGEDELMKMWYVSKPFEVVRVFDDSDDDENAMIERPRPLVAVDFGHAVWIEYDEEAAPPVTRPISVQHHPTTTFESPAMTASAALLENNSSVHMHVDGSENGAVGAVGSLGPGLDGHDLMSHDFLTLASHVMPYGIVHDDNDNDDLEHEAEPEIDLEPKVLRFVTFPGYQDEEEEWVEEEVEVEAEVEAEEEEEEEIEGDMVRDVMTKGGKGKQNGVCVDEELVNGLGQGQGQRSNNGKNKGKGKEKEKAKNRSLTCVNGGHYSSSSSSSASTLYTANGSHSKTPTPESTATLLKKKKKQQQERQPQKVQRRRKRERETEGVVRTLQVPEELDLGLVETINIDQSQGAVILSDRDGKIFILCYE